MNNLHRELAPVSDAAWSQDVYKRQVQRGTALLTTPKTAARARENFDISALPEDALDEINRIQTRQRFNEVVKTGSPGFIPQGR